jgi:WD40 repeat protein
MFDNENNTNISPTDGWECIYTFICEDTLNVYSVAITPDGRTVVSANFNEILIHDLNTGKVCNTLLRHSDQIISIDISPDGKVIASGGRDKAVKLWNLNTGELIKLLAFRADPIHSVAFSPDGKILATGGSTKYKNKGQEDKTTTIYLWNTHNGELIDTLSGHTLRINYLIFSPDSRILVSESNDGAVKVWNLQTQQLLYTILEESGISNGIAISPDSKSLFCLRLKGISIWNLSTGELTKKLSRTIDYPAESRIHPPGDRLLPELHGSIKAWNLEIKKEIFDFSFFYPNTNMFGWTRSIKFSRNGEKVVGCASFSEGAILKVWKIPNFTQDVLEIQKAETQLEKEDYFKIETIEDAREHSYASIVRRRGQKAFREKLLAAYNNQCAVTDCDAEQALEAAHIYPYKGDDTNQIWNGLILRSDIHTLFDLYLLTIDPEEKTVCLAPTLKNTTYRELNSKKIRLPEDPQLHPDKEVLIWHYKQCKWTNCL